MVSRPLTALVVEDVEQDALQIVRELERGGFAVTFERVDGPEAMVVALGEQPWDVVIARFVMPHFGALAALALLHERNLDLPVVIVCDETEEAAAAEALRAGAADFVAKDNLARLVPAVERELREAALAAERAMMREQLRAASALAEVRRSRLASIVDSSADAIVSKSFEGVIRSWNEAAERLFGYTADEMVGRSMWVLIPEGRRDEEARILERLKRGERIESFKTVRKRKDGSEIEVSVTLVPIEDESGANVGISTIARDITEVKRAQQALARARAVAETANEERLRLAAIIESSEDAIVSKSFKGLITTWNAAAERLLGYAADEIVGKSMWILIPENRREEEARIFECLKRGERVDSFETVRRRKDGAEVDVAVTFSPVKNKSGASVGISTIARDITQMKALVHAKDAAEAAHKESSRLAKQRLEQEVAEGKRAATQLRHEAYHDALTGLPNRAFLVDRLRSSMRRMQRHPECCVALLYLDVDRFKLVNDTLGHAAGNRFLAVLAPRLTSCLRPYDMLACLGGDEFAILLEDVPSPSRNGAATEPEQCVDVTGARDVCLVAERVLRVLAEPFRIDERDVFATTSIGIALGGPGYEDAEAMLRDADIAMYRAKQLGGGRYELCVQNLHAQATARLQLEMDLHRALERGELRLEYQPIVALQTGKLVGFEALARWHHAEQGPIPPSTFIPLAEEAGLIVALWEWVLTEACRQARFWHDLQPEGAPVSVSVNVSAKQLAAQAFDASRFNAHVTHALAESGLSPAHLTLEIPENTLSDAPDAIEAALGQLRSLGVAMQLDDFGTGYSSLSHLQRLPIDTVKIDRSFISGGQGTGIANPQIVRAIVGLARNLGKCVTAEGVETAEQLSELQALHCTYAQGYYLSRPVDEAGARALLAV